MCRQGTDKGRTGRADSRTGGEEERAHGGGHAVTHCVHVARDEVHGVEDGEAGLHGAAGAVDIQRYVGRRIVTF